MNRKNTVDYQELLKRYYEGKTTLEEENLLRTHLLSHTEENHADVSWLKKVKPSHLTEWNNVWKLG